MAPAYTQLLLRRIPPPPLGLTARETGKGIASIFVSRLHTYVDRHIVSVTDAYDLSSRLSSYPKTSQRTNGVGMIDYVSLAKEFFLTEERSCKRTYSWMKRERKHGLTCRHLVPLWQESSASVPRQYGIHRPRIESLGHTSQGK